MSRRFIMIAALYETSVGQLINLGGFSSYGVAMFKDALVDWGLFGYRENKPKWYPD